MSAVKLLFRAENFCGRVAAILPVFSAWIPEMSAQPERLGTPVTAGPRTFVQTERKAHEAWAKLTLRSPRAAAVMHHLVANMGHQNAVVISQKTLSKLLSCSIDTIQRAISELARDHWVQIVRLNGPGTVSAYVVNSSVAWGEKREHIGNLSVFHAAVIADADDQPEGSLDRTELRRIPMLFPGEQQLPSGDGLPPPSQPSLPGMEPDLPAARISETVDRFWPLEKP